MLLVATLVESGMLSSIFLVLALYTSVLTTSFFTTLLSLLNKHERVLIDQHLIYLLYFFQLLKPLGTFFNLSISSLSTLDFKLAKSTFWQILMYQHL